MNKKINLQDLAILSAEKSGIDKKEAELFLKGWIEIIQEALLSGDSVRIKNLGSFKRLEVDTRESVDIATGNRMEIPAHYKINFTPDNTLAHAVNEPFAIFDTVELDDTVVFNDTPEVKIEEPSAFTTNTDPNKRIHYSSHKTHHHQKSKKRKRKKLLNILFYSIITIGLVGVLAYLYRSEKSDELTPLEPDDIYTYNTGVLAKESTVIDSIPAVKDSVKPPVKKDTVQATTTKQHTMRNGERLTTIALSEYGAKVFWVYLYEENKSSIPNPNIIPEGAVIAIPPASKYGINKNDAASVQKAAALQTEIQQK